MLPRKIIARARAVATAAHGGERHEAVQGKGLYRRTEDLNIDRTMPGHIARGADGQHNACRALGLLAVRHVVDVRYYSGPRNDACVCAYRVAAEEHALERPGVLGSVGVLREILS